MTEKRRKWGERMIKFSVQFFTDQLPTGTDNKTAWAIGTIHLVANKSRGIKHDHVFFNKKEDFLVKLQELMDRNGVTIIEPSEKFNIVRFPPTKKSGN